MTSVRARSCVACPYRRDVPSGIWAAEEYEKLRKYDRPTWEQPPIGFLCHATSDFYCHGWAAVHGDHALVFRLDPPDGEIRAGNTPLFTSGAEAVDHGQADVDRPGRAAVRMIEQLENQHERLRSITRLGHADRKDPDPAENLHPSRLPENPGRY